MIIADTLIKYHFNLETTIGTVRIHSFYPAALPRTLWRLRHSLLVFTKRLSSDANCTYILHTFFKSIFHVVDLSLKSWYSKDSFVMHSIQIDSPYTATYDQRNCLPCSFYVFLEVTVEDFGPAYYRCFAYPSLFAWFWRKRRGSGRMPACCLCHIFP